MKLTSIAQLLLGSALVTPAMSRLTAMFDTHGSEVPFGTEKVCENQTSGCKTSVSLTCKFIDPVDGNYKSCIDNQPGTHRPFYSVNQRDCDANDGRIPVDAVITYRMCNDNDLTFHPIGYKNAIRFRKDNDVSPAIWDNSIAPNQCREYVLNTRINLCKPKRVFDIEMDGDLEKDYPRYCRCYLFKESNVIILPAVPTQSPTEYPTELPTKNPTKNPTKSPTSLPTPTPECADWDQVIITELASPSNAQNARYVELYFRESCRGTKIQRDLKVVLWTEGNQEPSLIKISLKGMTIPQSGFLVICNSISADTYYGWGTCNSYAGTGSPADLTGLETVAVVYHSPTTTVILDIFGVPGRLNIEGSNQDFSNGRAVRKISAVDPDTTFVRDHWVILRGDTGDCDPGRWLPVAEPPPPTEPPSLGIVPCDYYFTELAQPNDISNLAFIEIKATCPGQRISDIFVTAHKPSSTAVDLRPIETVPQDSFIIICENKVAFEAFYQKTCDVEDADVQPDGIYSLTLETYSGDVLDAYGYYPLPLYQPQIFTNGRAVRHLTANEPMPAFNPFVWTILPGQTQETVDAANCDPRDWTEDPLVIFFTEFCDPSDGEDKRFVELYSPNKKNYAITENINIFKYDQNFNIIGFESLKDKIIDAKGFIVLCVSEWDVKCTSVLGYNSVADGTGGTAYALSSCGLDNISCTGIDAFGPGQNLADTDYTDGRAYRLQIDPIPSLNFIPTQWKIVPGNTGGTVDSTGCDPGAWDPNEDTPNPPDDNNPTPTPNSGGGATPTAPSKGVVVPTAPSKGGVVPTAPSKGVIPSKGVPKLPKLALPIQQAPPTKGTLPPKTKVSLPPKTKVSLPPKPKVTPPQTKVTPPEPVPKDPLKRKYRKRRYRA